MSYIYQYKIKHNTDYKELLELAMYCLKSESKERLTFREVLEGKDIKKEEKIIMPPKPSIIKSLVTRLSKRTTKALPTERIIKTIHIKGLNDMSINP